MRKLSNTKGLSRIVLLAIVLAIALIVVVVIKVVNMRTESALQDMDRQVEIAAEHEARLVYTQNDMLDKMVYDAQNKIFVDPMEAKSTVKPYGSSKEHQGKYLLIAFSEDDNNVVLQWVNP